MMSQGMKNGTTDIWFETELEAMIQLKRWMPLPNTKLMRGLSNRKETYDRSE